MSRIRKLFTTIATVSVLVLIVTAGYAQRVNRQSAPHLSDTQMRYLLNSIEMRTDRFSASVPKAPDNSRVNSSNREDRINELVTNFESATDQLTDKFDKEIRIEPILRTCCNGPRESIASRVETGLLPPSRLNGDR